MSASWFDVGSECNNPPALPPGIGRKASSVTAQGRWGEEFSNHWKKYGRFFNDWKRVQDSPCPPPSQLPAGGFDRRALGVERGSSEAWR